MKNQTKNTKSMRFVKNECENSNFSGPEDMVTNHIYIGVTKFVINLSKYIEDEL